MIGGTKPRFWLQGCPLGDKQTLVNDVFHSVAQRYDLMNDLIRRGCTGLERPDDQCAQSAAPRHAVCAARCGRRHRRYRISRRRSGRLGFRATVCDIKFRYAGCWPRARGGPASRRRVSFVEGNAEALAFPDRSFDAYTIAFGIRNVPRIDLH